MFDKNKSLWGSWMIECNGQKIYFCGDTAYDTHFKDIAEKFSPINIALMPIGPCEPRKWVAHHHMDAAESVQAFIDLKADHFVPMHWGTFPLGMERFDTPMVQFKKAWAARAVSLEHKQMHILKAGQGLEVPELKQESVSLTDIIPKKKQFSHFLKK